MVATVKALTNADGLAKGRNVAVTSDGTVWVGFFNDAEDRCEFWWSADGVSFAEATSLRMTALGVRNFVSHGYYGLALFIDEADRLHAVASFSDNFVWSGTVGSGGGTVGAAVTSTSKWSTFVQYISASGGTVDDFQLVVFDPWRSTTSWGMQVIVAWTFNEAAASYSGDRGDTYVGTFLLNSTGNSLVGSAGRTRVANQGSTTNVGPVRLGLDFEHNGDGKTTTSDNQNIKKTGVFITHRHQQTPTTNLLRVESSGSAGTWPTVAATMVLDTGAFTDDHPIALMFDGTRVVVAYTNTSSPDTPIVKSVAPTLTGTITTETPPTSGLGQVTGLTIAADPDEGIHLATSNATADDVSVVAFNRAADTWDAWKTLAAGTVEPESLSVQPGHELDGVHLVWTDGTTIKSAVDLSNLPPTATWTSPGTNTFADRDEPLVLDWSFNDVDPGDSQTSFELERTINAGSPEYLDATTGLWDATAVVNTSAVSSVTLPAGWGTDGDVHVYRARVSDGTVTGPWSTNLTITADTQANPAITIPADASTVTTPHLNIAWTVSEQTARRVRLLDDLNNVIVDTGKTFTAATAIVLPGPLVQGASYSVEVVTWNLNGIESDTDSHAFTVTTAPFWVTRDGIANVNGPLHLTWAAAVQVSFELERTINGGAPQYWNAATNSWGSAVVNTSAVSSVTLPAGWGTDGDVHVYRARVSDGTVTGPWSTNLTITADTPIRPAEARTITGPPARKISTT